MSQGKRQGYSTLEDCLHAFTGESPIHALAGKVNPRRRNVEIGVRVSAAVEKKAALRLTGPVKHGALFKVSCRAQDPSAEMRGGFLR
jgi:hypothetical protein